MNKLIKKRLEKIQNLIKKSEFDSILISNSINRRYLSGFTGSWGYLFITESQSRLATDSRYIIQAEKESPEFEIISISSKNPWPISLTEGLPVQEIAFEPEDITVENFGSETASDIILELEETSLSPYIIITNGYATIDNLTKEEAIHLIDNRKAKMKIKRKK